MARRRRKNPPPRTGPIEAPTLGFLTVERCVFDAEGGRRALMLWAEDRSDGRTLIQCLPYPDARDLRDQLTAILDDEPDDEPESEENHV